MMVNFRCELRVVSCECNLNMAFLHGFLTSWKSRMPLIVESRRMWALGIGRTPCGGVGSIRPGRKKASARERRGFLKLKEAAAYFFVFLELWQGLQVSEPSAPAEMDMLPALRPSTAAGFIS
jgi:hypothetical protein